VLFDTFTIEKGRVVYRPARFSWVVIVL
jgi:hypothetical protein